MPTTTGITTEITIDNGTPMSGEFYFETDFITIQSNVATKPDSGWTCVDDAGHWHAYDNDGKLPTLEPRTRHVDCDGIHDFGDLADEDCEGFDVTDWHCRICDQQIEPRRLPDHGPRQVPGQRRWWAQVVSDHELPGGQAVIRVRIGNLLHFGVGDVRTNGMEGDSQGIRFTTRIDGIGPLGNRTS